MSFTVLLRFFIVPIPPALIIYWASTAVQGLGMRLKEDLFQCLSKGNDKMRIAQGWIKAITGAASIFHAERQTHHFVSCSIRRGLNTDVPSGQGIEKRIPIGRFLPGIHNSCTQLCLLPLVRSQPVQVLLFTVLSRYVESIFLRQSLADTGTAVSLIAVRDNLPFIANEIIDDVTVRMSRVMMSGNDVLCMDDTHPFHPLFGYLSHELIPFPVIWEAVCISWGERQEMCLTGLRLFGRIEAWI